MATSPAGGGIIGDIGALFDQGTAVGLTDGELLGRFVDRADRGGSRADPSGPAFAALVDRHGPMVLRVCRSILRDEDDAQDAFQATFLVLVGRARAVRRRESIGSWLHGVALRVSARARVEQARRRRHERQAVAARAAADRSDTRALEPEVAAAVHEELGRLPERYRAAVVLCYLEGHTCEAAAHRLGWPVGTVKSRLARGRDRLRGRLIRRGLAPDEASSTPAVLLPAALARATAEAMLRFAAGRPDAAPAPALSWTQHTLRTLTMTRLALISTLMIVGFAATGGAILIARDEDPAQVRSAAPPHEPVGPATSQEKARRFVVRVIDPSGRGVPGAEVAMIEEDAVPQGDGPAHRTAIYRTGADGRVQIAVHHRFHRLLFEAHPDDRTLGWAHLDAGDAWLKANGESPISLTLLPRDHRVEGAIVDVRGRPIGGVQVRAEQLLHDANGFAIDYPGYPRGDEKPALGSAVTDEAGRYRLDLPAETTAHFRAYHPRYVGPMFSCKPDDRSIATVAMEDAGGISGTVIDAATGLPVAGAVVSAQRIEHSERFLGGWGRSVSDTRGRFLVGGLQPGVYNLLFGLSPRGRRFTARAVEGVRVQAGREARADLRMIEGRRLHGRAIYATDRAPLVGATIIFYSTSHPLSSAACQSTFTDDRGRFEHFVPPGPALVYLNLSGPGSAGWKVLTVPEDGDPEPILLKQGHDPTAKPAPQIVGLVECEVRVRVKTDADAQPAPAGDRTLTGRVFDKSGSPLPAIQLHYSQARRFFEGATDRLGLFRLPGLPRERLELGLRRDGDHFGRATIPAEAAEVDIIIPEPPERSK